VHVGVVDVDLSEAGLEINLREEGWARGTKEGREGTAVVRRMQGFE